MTISAVIDAIDRYVMLVKTYYSMRNVLKVLSHVKVIKSDSLCHAVLTMSFIVPSVHCVTDNVLVPASTLDHVCQTTKVTLKTTREHAV